MADGGREDGGRGYAVVFYSGRTDNDGGSVRGRRRICAAATCVSPVRAGTGVMVNGGVRLLSVGLRRRSGAMAACLSSGGARGCSHGCVREQQR
ncbi:putative nitroreductase [Sesbania bispinosa]|nr:putative nitroreductase [Sesbania bispinosa]